MIQRVRASFDPERSGDLYVVLKPHVMPIADTTAYVATHGSPWINHRRMPILLAAGPYREHCPRPVETADIMPTLAAMIGPAVAPGSVDRPYPRGGSGGHLSFTLSA